MKYILGVFLFTIVGGSSAAAFELVTTEVTRPYEIVTVDNNLGPQHIYLGELKDFPIMYEISTSEQFDLSTKVRQRYNGSGEPHDFSLIVIRQNDRGGGVTEVARLRPNTSDWAVVKDSVFGMTFWESETLTKTVDPGVYRIEISTPENIGRYMLTIGEGGELPGYFSTIANIHTTQKFFGYSVLKLLTSSYVYYTLGIVFLLFIIQKTWRYRKSIAHVA